MPSFLNASSVFAIAANVEHTVSFKAKGEKFAHFWSKCVGAGRANEGLRAGWLEHLKFVKENCGFEYVRFHGLFHDDMCVYRIFKDAKTGKEKEVYNWQYIDDLFDRMLEIGVKPFVELGFMPTDMASGTTTQFWWKGNVTPPKDFAKWAELVSKFTQHCIDRYGKQEVYSWYFEVWNEPNLSAFWSGSKDQYFELYKVSVSAIKAIDPKLRVGGPSTSSFRANKSQRIEAGDNVETGFNDDYTKAKYQGVWILDFLAYCQKENLAIDFISTHPYPQGRGVESTKEDLTWLSNAVKKSAYPNAELHLTEWNTSASPRDRGHDILPVAAFLLKTNLDSIGLTDSLSYWTFTDVFEEKGAGDTIFHGGFGLINYQGIPKPAYHGYRMLHALGDEILHREDGMIVTRNSKTQKIVSLIYHFPPEKIDAVGGGNELTDIGKPKQVSLQLTDLPANTSFEIETIDAEHGNVLYDWRKMGSPEPPTREQVAKLKLAAIALSKEQVKPKKGILNYEKTIAPWTCVMIKQV
ncbi:hypothetical protein EZ428_18490 [Pedobacter frigiditerrae]|uniref:Glycosyl hydrolases family 39 N-terminal catalytic domain-containing protein n=2 Tax=Pedobacter frigiditerrae TaxID=2530452 RepID=A0A4R0MPM4_9SPHI|nr:hypothetical protein EZ428_18490 [Pedobacter frigiditerrae]